VFGHFTTPLQGLPTKLKAQRSGFRGLTFERDWCDDVELMVEGLDTPEQRAEFAREASSADLVVSFEAPDSQKGSPGDLVTAVYGHRRTLAFANRLQWAISAVGFRENNDIIRVGFRDWKVVVYGIPADVQTAYAQQAASAGFRVTFE
jgi:hypothetical protein